MNIKDVDIENMSFNSLGDFLKEAKSMCEKEINGLPDKEKNMFNSVDLTDVTALNKLMDNFKKEGYGSRG